MPNLPIIPQQPVQNPAPQAQQPAAQPITPVVKPAVPVQPAPQVAAKPVAAPQSVATQPAAATAKPATAPGILPLKDQAKSNKKFLLGCLAAFGCSLFLFIGILLAFLASGGNQNPIANFFGVPQAEMVNTLITLVNLIFLVLVFISFIFVVIGIFKITTARKDDKDAKKKGAMFAFASLAVMVVIIFVWIFAYLFLSQKVTTTVKGPDIVTVPEKTTGLTAPVTIKFDGSKANVDKKLFNILSYDWDFGDGAAAKGNPQTHTYTTLGNFVAKLSVSVKEKSTSKESKISFTRDITIQNVTATVVIKADKAIGVAPFTVKLDGSASSSQNGEITAYAWDLNEDGQFNDGDSATVEKTFDKVGKYKVSLRVTDSTGAFATGELDLEATVPDTPVAVINVEGVTGDSLEVNKSYMFNGADSTSPTGTVEKYNWDFGDGGKSATRNATHLFKAVGEYEVTLTVEDSSKKKNSAVRRFKVNAPDSPPLASLKTTPAAVNNVVSGQAPFEVIFDASGSQDPNNNIVEYAWDFNGDSKTDDANATTSYKFLTAGTYNVSLTVTDSTNLSAKAQAVVKVEAPGLKAVLEADPISGVVPLTVKFDASGSTYSDAKIVSYEWDFGDGTPTRIDTAKVNHQYTAIGTFNAKVTAITSDNKRASTQLPINVRPVPVKACFQTSMDTGVAPLEVQFDPTCSTGTVVKYNWNFANLGTSADRKPKFTFKNPGEYNVSLEVSDNQNVVDTFTIKITVTGAAQ